MTGLRLVIIFLPLLFVTNCTFSSSQYNFLRAMIKPSALGEFDASWQLEWAGREIAVLPVKVGSQTWFTNSTGNLIKFENWQVVAVESIHEELQSISLSYSEGRMSFYSGNKNAGTYNCGDWIESNRRPLDYVSYTQNCSSRSSGSSFVNEIWLDDNNEIFQIEFTVFPDHPSLVLSKRR